MYLDEEYVVVRGKGSKERLVPLSPVAAAEIRRWLVERADINVKPGEENMLFISRRGRRLTRVMIFYIVKTPRRSRGESNAKSRPTLCDIPLPPICLKGAPICALSSRCSATKA